MCQISKECLLLTHLLSVKCNKTFSIYMKAYSCRRESRGKYSTQFHLILHLILLLNSYFELYISYKLAAVL